MHKSSPLLCTESVMTRLNEIISAMSQALTLAFALFLVLGGSMGFYFAHSIPSLVGGLSTGLILTFASLKSPRSTPSRVTVALTSFFVSGFFFFRFLRTKKTFPAGIGAGAAFGVGLLNTVLIILSAAKDTDKTKKKDQ